MTDNESEVQIMKIKKLAGVENYETWAYKIKLVIMSAGAWQAVDPGSDNDETKWTEEQRKLNIKAYSTLCLSVEDQLHWYTSNLTTAKSAW